MREISGGITMKKTIIWGVVIAIAIGALWFFTSETFQQMTHPGMTKIAGVWVSQDGVNRITAGMHGDTYCTKCKKYNEGIVRICTYCGQYIEND